MLKGKARTIFGRSDTTRSISDTKFLVIPESDLAHDLGRALRHTNYRIISAGGTRIGEMLNMKNTPKKEDSVVYRIPCSGCQRSYFGETARGLATRLKEHKADVRHHRLSSALVAHIDKAGHLPSWSNAKVLRKGLNRRQRKVTEALYIATEENINQRTGDIVWAETAASVCAAMDPRGRERRPND